MDHSATMTPLLEVEDLTVHFPVREGIFRRVAGVVHAVDGVTFSIGRGETLGLVGESGSGKTTIGRSVLRAIEPTDGTIHYHVDGRSIDLRSVEGRSLRRFRQHVQMIFQDPYLSLNPRMRVFDIIAEPLVANGLARAQELDQRVRETAARCRLNPEHLSRYPHAFSGGQRQRVGIARALVTEPEFVVCDESVSALDVSIQAEILNLLMDLQHDLAVAFLFIAHDLSVVAHIADRVAVMYLGQLVELASTRELFSAPKHPYTEALLSAIPSLDLAEGGAVPRLEGEIPSPSNPPSGCRFHTRCPFATDVCRTEEPEFRMVSSAHHVRCHRAEELELHGVRASS